jgi:hypothetical protein
VKTASRLLPAILLLACAGPLGAQPPDPCRQFTWDVRAERALFALAPQEIGAAENVDLVPAVETGRLYSVHLMPEDAVAFAGPRGTEVLDEPGFGGLLLLRVTTAGRYRVSVDSSVWVDVIQVHHPVRSRGFQMAPACTAPHKIVEYELPSPGEYVLQLSGATDVEAHVAVTPVTTASKTGQKKPRRRAHGA